MWVAPSHRVGFWIELGFCSLTIMWSFASPELPLQGSGGMRETKSRCCELPTTPFFPQWPGVLKTMNRIQLCLFKLSCSDVCHGDKHTLTFLMRAGGMWSELWSASRCLLGVDACRFPNAELVSSELIWSNTLSSVGTYSHDRGTGNTCAYQTTAMAAAVGRLGLHTVQDPWFLQLLSSHISVISLALFLWWIYFLGEIPLFTFRGKSIVMVSHMFYFS